MMKALLILILLLACVCPVLLKAQSPGFAEYNLALKFFPVTDDQKETFCLLREWKNSSVLQFSVNDNLFAAYHDSRKKTMLIKCMPLTDSIKK